MSIHDRILGTIAASYIDTNLGEWDDDNGEIQSISKDELLAHYGYTKLSVSTVLRWMNALGMRYSERKKKYYVDGHERDDVVISRWKFISKYLRREMQMHRWVQLRAAEAQKYFHDGSLMEEHGFYNAAQDIYEFHVDVHKDFQELCKSLEFGGNLSIRKDPRSKVIISLGHDECIFNMFTYTKKCWSSCENAQPITPKDNGTGVMYSCIQSREFGFGFRDLTDGEIDLINSHRRRGKKYLDEDAAKFVNGTPSKPELKKGDNPFVRSFKYGANREGYWTYDRLILQLEDCMDILKELYDGNNYEFQFLVDHSCGHDQQRPNGLNVREMNTMFGKKQRKVHNTKLVKGCIGEYKFVLKEGDLQVMAFSDDHEGPFYMSPTERKHLRNGDLLNSKFENITKDRLLKFIFEKKVFEGKLSFTLGTKEYRVDHAKETIYCPDSVLPFKIIIQLCKEKNIDVSAEIESPDLIQTEKERLIKEKLLPHCETDLFMYKGKCVQIDRACCAFFLRNTVIPPKIIREICRQNGIEWREEKQVKAQTGEVRKTVKELLAELVRNGHHIPKTDRRRADIVKWCEKYNILTTRTVQKNITETWVGKPKGKLQVAYERGLLDLNRFCVEDFSDKGMLDSCGNYVKETSLNNQLTSCTDFQEISFAIDTG